jgi:hypothetical protein
MNKDEKQGMIGLAVIAVVLIVGGYFIYNTFFTYGSYDECLGDRTLKPGMSNAQVDAQEWYCRDYFYKKPKKVKSKTGEEIEEEERFAIKNCPNNNGGWPKFKTPTNQNRVETMSNGNKITCFQFEYLSKCVSRLDSGKLFYLPYPACKK